MTDQSPQSPGSDPSVSGAQPAHGQPTQPQPAPAYPPPPGMAPQPYPPSGYPPPYPPSGPPPSSGPFAPLVGRPLVSNETTWSTLAHLSIFAFGLLGPLIIMLTEGKKSAYTRHHAVEALNMHITLLIAEGACFVLYVVLFILSFALVRGGLALIVVPMLALLTLGVAASVYGIIAAIAASRGETYKYPFIFRMVK